MGLLMFSRIEFPGSVVAPILGGETVLDGLGPRNALQQRMTRERFSNPFRSQSSNFLLLLFEKFERK